MNFEEGQILNMNYQMKKNNNSKNVIFILRNESKKTMNDLIKIYRNNFFKKTLAIIFILFICVSIILGIIGYYYYTYQKNNIIEDRYEFLSSVSSFKKFQIIDWLNRRYNQFELIRANPPLISKLEMLSVTRNNVHELKEWFGTLKKLYQFDHILLVSSSLNIIYENNALSLNIDSEDSVLCKKSLASNSIIFSDSDEKYGSEENIKFYVPLSSNYKYIDKQASSVLILSIKPVQIFDALLNINLTRSTTVESILVKPFNEKIIYLNKPKFASKSESFDSNRKALLGVKTSKGFVEGIDYQNAEVIALIQNVPSTTWTLITKINKTEFYGPINDLAKLVILGVFSAALIFGLVLFLIWRKSILSNLKQIYNTELERLKSENRFDALIKGVQGYAIYMLDVNGTITSWNYGVELIKGYREKEFIGNHFSIFYTEDERQLNKPENSLKFAAEHGSYEEEGWRIKKSGEKFYANIVITALKDTEGTLYGYLKVTHDLTERKRAEEAIKNSRDFYLKLLNGFPTPIWLSGVDGKCNYFNGAWLKLTGRTLEEELGEGWTENLHPEDRDHVVNTYYESFSQMKDYILEYRLKNVQGEYRWMVVVGMPYFDMKNNFAGYLGSCYDINDRKKSEETINSLLRISEKLYSSLEIDQILDSLVIESIKLVDAQSGFAAIIDADRYSAKRYFNQDHWEYSDLTWDFESKISIQFINKKEGFIINNVGDDSLIHPDLKTKYSVIQSISVPLFGANGELMGFFETHNKKNSNGFNQNDLNHLKALAHNASISLTKSLSIEQLRKTELQLRNSESELRQLAAQLQYARETERHHLAREVHDELGQLFTGINLNILYLRDTIEQNDENLNIQRIISELNEVKKMVDKGIQSVRDIAEGLRSYVLEHLGLVHAIKEYCKEFQRVSNIKCTIKTYSEDINLGEEKSIAIYRIIQESLTNAMRHSRASEIKIDFSDNIDTIDISIEDNGIGFEEMNSQRLKTFGILGMKERALYINGTLTITSKPGSGTLIKVSLPLTEVLINERI